MTLTCCQDHILTENIWFVWSETSYCGDERRCYRCGTNEQTLKIELLSQYGGWRLSFAIRISATKVRYFNVLHQSSVALLTRPLIYSQGPCFIAPLLRNNTLSVSDAGLQLHIIAQFTKTCCTAGTMVHGMIFPDHQCREPFFRQAMH